MEINQNSPKQPLSQKSNQRESKKYLLRHMKMETQHTRTDRMKRKKVLTRKFILIDALTKQNSKE